METETITLTLPADLLASAQQRAAEENITLSALITRLLENDLVYEAARQRSIADMKQGLPFNTYGQITWTRDELHERN